MTVTPNMVTGSFTRSETIEVSVTAGAAIKVVNKLVTQANRELNLGYNAQLGYRQFTFLGYNTVLGHPNNQYIGVPVYVYIRLDASSNGSTGELVFLPYEVDYDGRLLLAEGSSPAIYESIPLETHTDSQGNTYYTLPNTNSESDSGLFYYYIHIASLSAPENGQRAWTVNLQTGQLETAKGNDEKQDPVLEKMFRLVNNVINVLLPFDKLSFSKSAPAFVERILTTTSESIDDFATWAQQHALATTASIASYVSARLKILDDRFFRKDQPDTDPHLATFGDLHVKKGLSTDPEDPTALSGGNMLVEGDAEFEGDVQTHGATRLSTNGETTTIGGTATIAGTTTIGNFREHTEIQEGSGAQVAEDGSAKFYGRESRMRTVIFGNYEPGMIAGAAHGAKIEESGDGRFKSVSISESLEVPEIRFNRATVYIGIGIRSVGGGIIEEVIPEQEGGVIIAAGRASVKLEDGEYGALDLADKMLGFWHNEGLPGQAEDNAVADRDDHNGDYELKGFQSVYFRIDGFYANEQDFKAGTNVIQDEVTPRGANKYFHYSLRTTGVHGWTLRHHPHQGMHFGLIANDRNASRQSLFITTTEYELSLQNLTDWNYDSSNITKIDGKLDGFSMPSQRWNDQTQQYETYLKPFFGNGTVLGNAYIYGKLDQFERVTYRCYVQQSLNGSIGIGETEVETVSVVNGYGEDVTSEFSKFTVTRDSGDAASDAAWNAQHTNVGNPFSISSSDLGIDGIHRLSTQFYVTATDEATETITPAAILDFAA